MGRPVAITKTLTAANAAIVAASQSPLAAGALSLVGGGTVVLDSQRRIIVTSAADDSAKTFTFLGTNSNGSFIKDSFAGAAIGVAQSNIDFKTVTAGYVSAATAGAITVGTNTVGSCHWVRADPHLTPFEISLMAQLVTGTGTISLDYTYDEFLPEPQNLSGGIYAVNTPNPLARVLLDDVAATQDAQPLTSPCLGWRFTIKTGTGTWKVTGTQQGLAGP